MGHLSRGGSFFFFFFFLFVDVAVVGIYVVANRGTFSLSQILTPSSATFT